MVVEQVPSVLIDWGAVEVELVLELVVDVELGTVVVVTIFVLEELEELDVVGGIEVLVDLEELDELEVVGGWEVLVDLEELDELVVVGGLEVLVDLEELDELLDELLDDPQVPPMG